MSNIFYRFPHQPSETRLTFDGTHISVFDVKKEVMLQMKMGSGKDFDLGVFDGSSGEELKDDHHQIPRSTSITIRRLPPNPKSKNGGTAARYIAGTSAALGGRDDAVDKRVEAGSREELMNRRGLGGRGLPMVVGARAGGHLSARFDGRGEEKPAEPAPPATEEEARLAAFLNESANQWEETHEQLSHQTRIAGGPHARGSFKPRGMTGHANWAGTGPPPGMSSSNWHFLQNPDKEPPSTYTCFRCGQKGHWIQACPQNETGEADNKPRFKRTTGIPKSFLKTVEKPSDDADASSSSSFNPTGGVLITGDGTFVTVQPDRKLWKKTTKSKRLTAVDVLELTADSGSSGANAVTLPKHLTCPICTRLLHTPSRTPCCKSLYCEECIHTHLLENDFVCPGCESKVGSLKEVRADETVRGQVEEFVEGEVDKRRSEREAMGEGDEEGEEKEGIVKEEGGKTPQPVKSEDPIKSPQTTSKSPNPTAQPASSPAQPSSAALPSQSQAQAESFTANMNSNAMSNTGVASNNNNTSMTPQAHMTGQQQQQQQPMNPEMMMNMMNMMQMGMMGMNPLMALQAQAAQCMMLLQNPQLAPPMRMQLQMQMQMLQGQMMAMSGGNAGNGSPNAMGNGGGTPSMGQQQQQQQYGNGNGNNNRPVGRPYNGNGNGQGQGYNGNGGQAGRGGYAGGMGGGVKRKMEDPHEGQGKFARQ